MRKLYAVISTTAPVPGAGAALTEASLPAASVPEASLSLSPSLPTADVAEVDALGWVMLTGGTGDDPTAEILMYNSFVSAPTHRDRPQKLIWN